MSAQLSFREVAMPDFLLHEWILRLRNEKSEKCVEKTRHSFRFTEFAISCGGQ
jgi:hypothetical protein